MLLESSLKACHHPAAFGQPITSYKKKLLKSRVRRSKAYESFLISSQPEFSLNEKMRKLPNQLGSQRASQAAGFPHFHLRLFPGSWASSSASELCFHLKTIKSSPCGGRAIRRICQPARLSVIPLIRHPRQLSLPPPPSAHQSIWSVPWPVAHYSES